MEKSFIEIYKIEKSICDDLIAYYKKNKEYKNFGHVGSGKNIVIDKNIKESTDVTFFNQSEDKTIKLFFKNLGECVKKYTDKYELNMHLWTDNINLIQYYPPNGGFKVWHFENQHPSVIRRTIVYMLYLNDIKGGGTEWLYQDIKLDAVKGNLILWPAGFTHKHRGVVTNKEKYIATGWLENI